MCDYTGTLLSHSWSHTSIPCALPGFSVVYFLVLKGSSLGYPRLSRLSLLFLKHSTDIYCFWSSQIMKYTELDWLNPFFWMNSEVLSSKILFQQIKKKCLKSYKTQFPAKNCYCREKHYSHVVKFGYRLQWNKQGKCHLFTLLTSQWFILKKKTTETKESVVKNIFLAEISRLSPQVVVVEMKWNFLLFTKTQIFFRL